MFRTGPVHGRRRIASGAPLLTPTPIRSVIRRLAAGYRDVLSRCNARFGSLKRSFESALPRDDNIYGLSGPRPRHSLPLSGSVFQSASKTIVAERRFLGLSSSPPTSERKSASLLLFLYFSDFLGTVSLLAIVSGCDRLRCKV